VKAFKTSLVRRTQKSKDRDKWLSIAARPPSGFVDPAGDSASDDRGTAIAKNRFSLSADQFSDATDLTALPFDRFPTTFSIALPFLHRPLIVSEDVATSVTPPWPRHREREKGRTGERERRKRPRDQDGRTFIRRRR